jgi:hypothetical protein
MMIAMLAYKFPNKQTAHKILKGSGVYVTNVGRLTPNEPSPDYPTRWCGDLLHFGWLYEDGTVMVHGIKYAGVKKLVKAVEARTGEEFKVD